MKRKSLLILLAVILLFALTTTAFAIEESEVESAIAASSEEEVAGNIFIWFLCAIGFLKVSQKIDSFMASLGVNVGRTGGSMLAELMIAGRTVAGAASMLGGSIFNRHSSHSNNGSSQAAGAAFTGGGNSLISVAKRSAGNAAAASATGTATGLGGLVGGAMFASSLKNGGQFANSVIGAVAKGNISSVGSITGEQASEALSSYLGYAQTAAESTVQPGVTVPVSPDMGDDTVTLDGGTAAGAQGIPNDPIPAGHTIPAGTENGNGDHGDSPGTAHLGGHTEASPTSPAGGQVPQSPPTFRNVEIGGGRITGVEVAPGGQAEREFAMYNTEQYMPPTGPYDTVQTVDGASWYRQYAQPTVEKTPYQEGDSKIRYQERIVQQMPQVPKRKDKI